MNYKRLEIYVGWTCNKKCTYCVEFSNMEEVWNKKVSKYDILKKLIKYKRLGYNHVTYLGGEPFIQGVFFDALKIGKKLGYIILVTTNCTTLHIESQAIKFLPYIDELFLSFEGISIEQQQKISRSKNYVHWDLVFENINRYWKGSFLKANIVITQDNKNNLSDFVHFLFVKGIKNISITYPDINYIYYSKEHIIENIAPKYSELIPIIIDIVDFSYKNDINLKLPDFPFCVFPKKNIKKYIKLTDDYDYFTRLKIDHYDNELDRKDLKDNNFLPRMREHSYKCKSCKFINKCWGPSKRYKKLYGLNEINPITE